MANYIFTDAQRAKELERLRLIEQVFDPATQRRILATGIAPGWQCLEVGAGAGSIAQWLSATVGEQGKVVAVDLDTRFLTPLAAPNLTVLQTDVQQLPLALGQFDLVHARYVLIHNADFQVALTKMLELLKPGGWLVLEEPDFAAARAIAADPATSEAMERVKQAIAQMFADRGMDYALGVKLPAICQTLGLQLRRIENDANPVNGGSGLATVMKLSALQLADQYLATGKVTPGEIDTYCSGTEDPRVWTIYYATVGVVAQKPGLE